MSEISEKEALNKMAAYCSRGEHCRFEVKEKLTKMELSAESIESILKSLEAERYIDEDRYCRSFVKDKLVFNKWGKLKIAQALSLKRIPKTMIRKHLDEIDKELYLEILAKVAQTKRKEIRAKNDYEFKQKLIRSLLGRGFEMDDVLKYVDL